MEGSISLCYVVGVYQCLTCFIHASTKVTTAHEKGHASDGREFSKEWIHPKAIARKAISGPAKINDSEYIDGEHMGLGSFKLGIKHQKVDP